MVKKLLKTRIGDIQIEKSICESFLHKWHRCAIHGNLAIGGPYLVFEDGVIQKNLKQKKVCTCYMNDSDLAKLYPFIKDTEAEKVFVHLTWRLKKVRNQERELRKLKDSLGRKNLELDALHYVWCDGGCSGGVHRYKEMEDKPLTKEIVDYARYNTERLRIYYSNKRLRDNKYSWFEYFLLRVRWFFVRMKYKLRRLRR